MKMFIMGEKIDDDTLVDGHGLFVEGDSFEVRAGKLRFTASGDADHSRWMLSPDHTAGLVQKAAT